MKVGAATGATALSITAGAVAAADWLGALLGEAPALMDVTGLLAGTVLKGCGFTVSAAGALPPKPLIPRIPFFI